MKTLLLIAYEYPPMNTGGAVRPERFARLLAMRGLRIIVVAGLQEGIATVTDEAEHLTVHRVPLNAEHRFTSVLETATFSVTDRLVNRWRKPVLGVIDGILASEHIDVLMATAPPFSVAVMAGELSKRHQLPLIVDLRDAWSQWGLAPYPSRLHYQLTLRYERKVINTAAAVLCVTPEMKSDLMRVHGEKIASKLHVYPNTIDGELPPYDVDLPVRRPTPDRPLRIGYFGSFYYTPGLRKLIFDPWYKKKPHQVFQYAPRKEDWLYRSPWFVLKSWAEHLKRQPSDRALIVFEFAGNIPAWLTAMIAECDLSDRVVLHGLIDRSTALDLQRECDVLLATSVHVHGGLDYCIAGKTYEYFLAQKPILAFVKDGAQKRIIEASGAGVLVDPDDLMATQHVWHALLTGGLAVQLKPSSLASYRSSTVVDALFMLITEKRT